MSEPPYTLEMNTGPEVAIYITKDTLINKRLLTSTRESATSYGGTMPTEVGGVVERYEVRG